MSDKIKIAIISDIHAHENQNESSSPSYFDIALPDNVSPISALLKLIKKESLNANYLFCPGDITDKARPVPLKYAWEKLQNISKQLNCEEIIATAGNHDLDSSHKYNDFDAKGMVQELDPLFPTRFEVKNNKYWAQNYLIWELKEFNLLLINSCAYHAEAERELKHGRISNYTIDSIVDELEEKPKIFEEKPNLLLCHHHIIKHNTVEKVDYQYLRRGEELLNKIGSGSFGHWLAIHGHIHIPEIKYAAGTARTPVVFSSGSFSAVIDSTYASTKNQFYIIEIRKDKLNELGLVGRGKAWDYSKDGWSYATPYSGLPKQFGFGCKDDPELLAKKVSQKIETSMKWEEITNIFENLKYMLPKDLNTFENMLSEKFGYQILKQNGEFYQVSEKN